MIDVLFISPGNASGIYQNLATDYAAIEPPTWALLLARSMSIQKLLCRPYRC
jgi:anaerobic magnesium-protoporphyrin IX monomethyl ester cyclase